MFLRFCLILLLSPLFLFSQGTVSIQCSFEAAGIDTGKLIPSIHYLDDLEIRYASVIGNHKCEFKIAISYATPAKFIYRSQVVLLFLEPGDQLKINIGSDSLYKAISFSGKGAVHNDFLVSFYKAFAGDFDLDKVNARILATDADAFEMYLFEERKKQMVFYESANSKNSFSAEFKKFMENTIKYNYPAKLLSYPIIQANQSPKILTVKGFPDIMLEGINSKLVNDEALNCESYREFLYFYAVYFASKANGFNKFKDYNLSADMKVQVATREFAGKSQHWAIAYLLNKELARISQYTAGKIYNTLSIKEGNGTYTKLLKNKVDARLAIKDAAPAAQGGKETKASPENAPSGTHPKLKDPDGNYFTLDDFKGKVVYIDYWASWCGPCRSQMPYSKQLQAMFTEKQLKQLVFLYISIDADENAWKNGIKTLGIEGKNGLSPGNWQSPIAVYFGINSIPRYMLMDKKGNIVDLSAKRPSDLQNIYNDILKLIEE